MYTENFSHALLVTKWVDLYAAKIIPISREWSTWNGIILISLLAR